MFEPNLPRILSKIGDDAIVLDVGGWARCFNRANYVLDSGPYETRGRWYRENMNLDAQGGEVEHFTEATWFTRDICDHTPWPLADKSIDFCTCSHTLEDIRDPLWVCSEMIRVAKAGYIEVPSRMFEQCRGREPRIVGLSHHRWLVEIEGQHLKFYQKYHAIHSDYRASFPSSFRKAMTPEQEISYLFWEDSFTFEEVTIHGSESVSQELSRYVRQHYRHPPARVALESAKSGLNWALVQPGRVVRKLRRMAKGE